MTIPKCYRAGYWQWKRRRARPKSMLAADKTNWWRPKRGEQVYVCWDHKWGRRRPGWVTSYCRATDTIWLIYRDYMTERLCRKAAIRMTDDRGREDRASDKAFVTQDRDAVWPKWLIDACCDS